MSTLSRIIALKDKQYRTDADFERAAKLKPKLFDKWLRGSHSYYKYLPGIAHALGTTADYLLDIPPPTTAAGTSHPPTPPISAARAEALEILSSLPDHKVEKFVLLLRAAIDVSK